MRSEKSRHLDAFTDLRKEGKSVAELTAAINETIFTCCSQECPRREQCWHFSLEARPGLSQVRLNPATCKHGQPPVGKSHVRRMLEASTLDRNFKRTP